MIDDVNGRKHAHDEDGPGKTSDARAETHASKGSQRAKEEEIEGK